jgi:hypothetical protein
MEMIHSQHLTTNRIVLDLLLLGLAIYSQNSLPPRLEPSLKALSQNSRLPGLQVQQALSEKSIRPTEPLPRPLRLVKAIDTLMNQSQAICTAHNLCQCTSNFVIVVCGKDADDASHRPSLAEACVWTADTDELLVGKLKRGEVRDERVDDGATHEVGVVFAKNELSGVLVNLVACIKVAEERGAEQTGDVGVVHDVFYQG